VAETPDRWHETAPPCARPSLATMFAAMSQATSNMISLLREVRRTAVTAPALHSMHSSALLLCVLFRCCLDSCEVCIF